jgi:hypothetical protein
MDYQKELTNAVMKLCKKQGWPITTYHIPINKGLEDAVNKYVMEIEEAHKKAAKSTLRFGYCL